MDLLLPAPEQRLFAQQCSSLKTTTARAKTETPARTKATVQTKRVKARCVGGNGSGAEVAGSGAVGSGAACVDGAGSLDGSVGSDQGGRATSSMDSCACAARTAAKNIAATSTDGSSGTMGGVVERSGGCTKHNRGAWRARLDWRHIAVNQKILVKIRKFGERFTSRAITATH